MGGRRVSRGCVASAAMVDQDTEDYREAMVEWAALTHEEVRSIRRMVQFVFALWLLSVAMAVVVAVVAAAGD